MKKRSRELTHKIMASIKGKDTKPELMLRKCLWAKGIRYRIQGKITGKPDIYIRKYSLAIFVDGDFWHGNNWKIRGLRSQEDEFKRYSKYWKEKISKNIERDRIVTKRLKKEGWKVMRFWESDILKDVNKCATKIEKAIKSKLL